ncbi:HNH endonuclease [Phormidium sp. LEGE 05292]|uniref:HNH endonuclease n=1 Tax=[Phormidium] sp. LEGE 05292 TaxID=767427 RepID=UPI00187E21D0|nr:HNH endonuclease signature motif containing protein [Phormidium sp. LEGE 05292]MBE9229107.1 HNH endonuclease [Phormidium sp. LEGE 05292]
MDTLLPKVVVQLTDAVSEKLGRPAYCRKVLNRDEWYINDPVFSFIQRGTKNGGLGYRVGYYVDLNNHEVWFVLLHSVVMAKLFQNNLAFSTLIEVLKKTADFRDIHWLYRSSKQAVKLGFNDGERIDSESIRDFIRQLEDFDEKYGFVKDLFPKRLNTGKGGGFAFGAGHTFYLGLVDKFELMYSTENIKRLIELTWPLFLCLYPIEPIEKRSACLARNMKVAGIPKECEFSLIQFTSESTLSPLCRGQIQGAHIKPHAEGGSDRPENGIWLCEFHHRITEGKLKGQRKGKDLAVRFIDS